MSGAFKILVTSQKGGVGKSTLSANLAAYLQDQQMSVTMIDFDLHGSSSNWLKRAPSLGVVVQHHPLPLSMGGNRPLLEARLHLRRAVSCSDVVICDLTWTDAIAGELMFDFDVVVVPTSVSEMELATTAGFLAKHHWVFDSKLHKPPTLLLAPTRVRPEQMAMNSFSKQRFPVSFLLSPPVLESQSARDSFEVGYLKDLQDACGHSFREFGKAVFSVRELRRVASAQTFTAKATSYAHLPTGRFVMNGSLSERQSLLSRHRIQQMPKPAVPMPVKREYDQRYGQVHASKPAKATLFQSIVKKLVNF